jgi:hypothetical protein
MKEDWNSRRQYFLMTRVRDNYRVQALLHRQRFFAVPPYRGPYTYSHLFIQPMNCTQTEMGLHSRAPPPLLFYPTLQRKSD